MRKKRGNFLEDFRVGQLFRHKVGKTVTEGLFNAFTGWDTTTNPLHKNRRYAEAYGFRGDVWTASRVAEVIHRTFGVRYHRDHVGRLLREAGWSRQQPNRPPRVHSRWSGP